MSNESDVMFLVTVIREPRWKQNLRLLTVLIFLFAGVILSHLIAASWVIEFVFVCLSFLMMYIIFDQRPIKDRRVHMTRDELLKWLAADCPEQWP